MLTSAKSPPKLPCGLLIAEAPTTKSALAAAGRKDATKPIAINVNPIKKVWMLNLGFYIISRQCQK